MRKDFSDRLRWVAGHTVVMLWAAFALVVFFTYRAYSLTFDFGFMFDDYPTIINNFFLKLDTYRSFLFAHSRWVSMLWNSFTYHNFGLGTRVLRSQNLVLHLFNASMILGIFRHLLSGMRRDLFVSRNASWIAFIAAALFLLHPAQTQTATYITQTRLEGLAVSFILVVLGLFIFGVRVRSWLAKFFVFGLMGFVAACSAGTKEIVIFTPILIGLVDFFFISQGSVREILSRWYAYVVVTASIGFAFYSFSFSSTVPFALSSVFKLDAALDNNRGNLLSGSYKEKITALRYLISEFRVMVHYIKIYFCPTGLSFDYDWRLVSSFWQFDVIAPLLFLVSVCSGAVILWWYDLALPVSFGIFWFFVAVLPRASIVPSAEMACDYKTHLGSVGMMVLLAYLLVRLVALGSEYFNKNFDPVVRGLATCLLLGCAYQGTVARNDVWSSNLKFWGDVIRKAPKKSRAYNNYAVALAESGAAEESLEYYKKSCECDPQYAEPLINLGSHYQMKGEDETALFYYGKALNLTHEPHPECYNNVGLIQYQHKNYEKAKSCFKTAILLRGHYGKAHYNLAKVYYEEGDLNSALESSSNAIRGDFPMPHVYLLHGKCAVKLDRYGEGIVSLERALSAGYDFEGVFLLGMAYYNERNYEKAVFQFERAYSMQPNNLTCAYNYAQALMNSGRCQQAVAVFEKCKDDPKFPYSILHIAKCHSEMGERHQAMALINSVLTSQLPDFVKNDAVALRSELIRV